VRSASEHSGGVVRPGAGAVAHSSWVLPDAVSVELRGERHARGQHAQGFGAEHERLARRARVAHWRARAGGRRRHAAHDGVEEVRRGGDGGQGGRGRGAAHGIGVEVGSCRGYGNWRILVLQPRGVPRWCREHQLKNLDAPLFFVGTARKCRVQNPFNLNAVFRRKKDH